MPRDSKSPEVWLAFAKSDLAAAHIPVQPPVLLETVCFNAQQAAEKAVKAVLIHFSIQPPKIHDIRRLIERLPAGLAQPDELRESVILTGYATLTRYPWGGEPVSEEEYRQALRLAEAVVAWAEAVIAQPNA